MSAESRIGERLVDASARIGQPRTLIWIALAVFLVTSVSELSEPVLGLIDGIALDGRPGAMGSTAAITLILLSTLVQSAAVLIAVTRPVLAITIASGSVLALGWILGTPNWVQGGLVAVGAVLFVTAASHHTGAAVSAGALATAALLGSVWLWIGTLDGLGTAAVVALLLRYVILLASLCWIPLLLGNLLGRAARREATLRLEQAGRVAAAKETERARVAQELHDVTGHHLFGLLSLADAAAASVGRDSATAEQIIGELRVETRFAVASLYGSLGVLRAGAPDVEHTQTLFDLPAVFDRARSAGQEITSSLIGDLEQVPTAVSVTALRVVQESLTNARKHARGGPVTVEVNASETEVVVLVRNRAGEPRSAAVSGLGMGIAGMRERVELLDGVLEAGPDRAGGWVNRARIPLDPAGALSRELSPSDRMVS